MINNVGHSYKTTLFRAPADIIILLKVKKYLNTSQI
jgi:hypothetical protein